MDLFLTILTTILGGASALSPLGQFRKTLKLKRSDEVSIPSFALPGANQIGFLSYGIYHRNWFPLAFVNAVALVCSIMAVVTVFYYRFDVKWHFRNTRRG